MSEQHITSRPISRRSLLRSALLGGAGLAGAYLLGCGDGGQPDTPALITLTPPPTPTLAPGSMRWEQLQPTGAMPPPRKHHSLVLGADRLFLFGGQNDGGDLADLWAYDPVAGEWRELAAGGPATRHGHNAVWDTVNGRMLVFGGQQGSDFFNDLWQYDPAEDRWAELSPSGPVPAARYGAGGAFSATESGDPSAPFLPGSLIITHGFTASGRFDDTWAFDAKSNTWTDVSPSDERPVERCLMRATWDTLRNRLVMFGGQTDTEPFLDDLWTLSSSRGWSIIFRQPQPSGRTFYSLVNDPERNSILLFGGNTEDGPNGEVWVFHVQDEFWTGVEPDGLRPSARFGHDAVWLPDSSSMLVSGGNDGSGDLNDLWELRVLA